MHDLLMLDVERERSLLWHETFRRLCTITREGRSEDAVQASMESWHLFASNYRLMCRDDFRRN